MNERNARWHQMTSEEVARQLHTDAACGLSRKAARSRFKKTGGNSLFDRDDKRRSYALREWLPDSACLLCIGAIVLAMFFFQFAAGMFALLLLLLYGAVMFFAVRRGIAHERRAVSYRIPTVRVIRDGKCFSVSARRVVPGDLLLLRAGDIVPCDCRIVCSDHLRVLTLMPNERGEACFVELPKSAETVYPYRADVSAPAYENMLYGGSELFTGSVRAIAAEVGEHTFLGAMESFSVPAERSAVGQRRDAFAPLKPYLRFYGFLMPLLLLLFALLAVLLSPNDVGVAEILFSLCALCGTASPALLYHCFRLIAIDGQVNGMTVFPTENRVMIKSSSAAEKLNTVTDLFVIGHRGCSDGVLHFQSAVVGREEIQADAAVPNLRLHTLCEAFCLLRTASEGLTEEAFSEGEDDSVFLSELIRVSAYDVEAMKIRLQQVALIERTTEACAIRVTFRERNDRLLFSVDETWIDRCMLYEEGGRQCAISSEHRAFLHDFVRRSRRDAGYVTLVVRQPSDGVFSLVGILSKKERLQAILPSVSEELTQSGVNLHFFLCGERCREEELYAAACRLPQPYLVRTAQTPAITDKLFGQYRVFIGFSKEEIARWMRRLRSQGRNLAIVGGNADDRWLLQDAAVVISCDVVSYHQKGMEEKVIERLPQDGKENSTRASQVMRRHADVILHRAGRFSGGLAAVLQALSDCRSVRVKMRLFLRFLILSQLARICVSACSIVLGLGTVYGGQVLYSGFWVESVALWTVIRWKPPQSSLRKTMRFDGKSIEKLLLARDTWLPICIAAAIVSVCTAVLVWTRVLDAAQATVFLFASLVLLQWLLFCQVFARFEQTSIRSVMISSGMSMLLPVVILCLLSVWLPFVDAATGMGHWHPVTLCALPMLPLVYLLACKFFVFRKRRAK